MRTYEDVAEELLMRFNMRYRNHRVKPEDMVNALLHATDGIEECIIQRMKLSLKVMGYIFREDKK